MQKMFQNSNKNTIKFKSVFLLFVLPVFIFAFFVLNINSVYAQIVSTDVALTLIPEHPAPGDSVTATITSYVVSLDKAFISWNLDGREISNGIGKKSVIFNIDDSDNENNLSVRIDTFDGKSIQKNLVINGSNVDMLWEAVDSFVPPFYRGKALVAPEGTFKVVAIPNINSTYGKINPNNMSYKWEQDGDIRQNASGWGKSSLIFQNNYLEKINEISVIVTDISGRLKSEGKTTLQTFEPRILFYKKSLTSGIDLSKTINDNYTVSKEGETLVAMPYFFSPKNIENPLLSFTWYLGDEKIKTPSIKNEINIRPEAGKSGSSKIKLQISNTKTLFQEAEKEVLVNF